jgi:glutamate-ammonia-ligase adenylyltransferase
VTIVSAFTHAIDRARDHAPFLRVAMEVLPDLTEQLATGQVPPSAEFDPGLPPSVALRRARRREALTVAIADLAGALDLRGVTGRLTDFADRALDTAIVTAIRERTPDAEPVGFAAIALGKQGSGELNYSSDIDPILLFDPLTLPHRPREEPEEAAVRIGRRVVELLQSRDGEGYVLRVDLRLRPSPEVTPIALPIDAAISYYESQALPWERAAFIRARAAAGDLVLGRRFLEAIRPFVWRRGLDFGAVGEIREITRRIRDHHSKGQSLGPGFDLKRGRGGIREIEFFAQIQQLIHGGRDPALRAPATMDALDALAQGGWIPEEEARALSDAYVVLRTTEHRLQMVDDRQTHALPRGEALDNVARLDDRADGDALIAMLAPHVAIVGTTYDSLDPPDDDALSFDDQTLAEQLLAAGFNDHETAAQAVRRWRGGAYPALRSPVARQALEAVLPGLVVALGKAPDPRTALVQLDTLIARLPSAINFFRLLEAQPQLAQLMAAILSYAPPLAQILGRRPALLDGLIDATALAPVGDVAALAAEMRGEAANDYEAALQHVRLIVGEKRFALGAQLMAGASDPLAVAQGYARVAEAAILILAEATVDEFARAHGHVPDSELVILALGRLGGGALTHASDLDLVYLFTGDFAAESDGPKPLGAVHYYNRLAQRLSAALSVPTAAGALYEIDTRLRPSGTQGPLVVSLDGFAQYQRKNAWTWEHMALTRARPVFGSQEAREAVTAVVTEVLTAPRDVAKLVADALQMRGDVTAHKAPLGPLDAKLLPGGLVDLEFAVHVTQLANRGAGLDPDLSNAIASLAERDLLPPLGDAYAFLTRLLVMIRLVAPDCQPPSEAAQALVSSVLGAPDWAAMIARFDATRQEVAAAWQAIGGQNGGT